MVGFKRIEETELWECDTCGQVFNVNLRWHSVNKKIIDKFGVSYKTEPCYGVLRRIE